MASSLRSYLFTSATVRIGVPIAPKYGTVSMEPTRYVTLHFRDQRGAASLRHRHRAEITSLCVNRSPIRYDFWTSKKAIQCSANIAYTVTTCTPRAPILQQLTVEPLYDSHFLWDRDGLHGRLKKKGREETQNFPPFCPSPPPIPFDACHAVTVLGGWLFCEGKECKIHVFCHAFPFSCHVFLVM